jgi:hypothetical protein
VHETIEPTRYHKKTWIHRAKTSLCPELLDVEPGWTSAGPPAYHAPRVCEQALRRRPRLQLSRQLFVRRRLAVDLLACWSRSARAHRNRGIPRRRSEVFWHMLMVVDHKAGDLQDAVVIVSDALHAGSKRLPKLVILLRCNDTCQTPMQRLEEHRPASGKMFQSSSFRTCMHAWRNFKAKAHPHQ